MSNHADPMVWKPAEIQKTPSRPSGVGEFEIDVVFTTYEGTLAALERAGELSRDLGAGLRLVVPQVVPYACPIEHPPVAVGFIRKRMLDLVMQAVSGNARTTIDIYLCRDGMKTLLDVLKPNSLVMIGGGKRRWWATMESGLAKALRSHGHDVLSVNLK